jgi:hypothetical protein
MLNNYASAAAASASAATAAASATAAGTSAAAAENRTLHLSAFSPLAPLSQKKYPVVVV